MNKSYSNKATYTCNGRVDTVSRTSTDYGVLSYVKELVLLGAIVGAALAIVTRLF